MLEIVCVWIFKNNVNFVRIDRLREYFSETICFADFLRDRMPFVQSLIGCVSVKAILVCKNY